MAEKSVADSEANEQNLDLPASQKPRVSEEMAGSDPSLETRVRHLLRNRQGVTEKKMFGSLAFLLEGTMLFAVSDRGLMARIGREGYEAALAMKHVREIDFTGRPMKGYVYVDAKGLEFAQDLKSWVDRCVAFVASLPPKPGK